MVRIALLAIIGVLLVLGGTIIPWILPRDENLTPELLMWMIDLGMKYATMGAILVGAALIAWAWREAFIEVRLTNRNAWVKPPKSPLDEVEMPDAQTQGTGTARVTWKNQGEPGTGG